MIKVDEKETFIIFIATRINRYDAFANGNNILDCIWRLVLSYKTVTSQWHNFLNVS